MRRAASLVLLAAAAAQSPYSADQRQDFERTRQELLARDPLAAKLRDEHLHGRLPMLWHTPFMFPFHGVPADYFRYTHAGAAAVCEDAGLEVIEAAPDGGYAAVLGHVVGMDTRFFSDEEIHRVHELPHWKDLDNLHHKVSYHLSTKLVARKPPSN